MGAHAKTCDLFTQYIIYFKIIKLSDTKYKHAKMNPPGYKIAVY